MYATIPKAGFLCKGEYNNSNRGIGEPPPGVYRMMGVLLI